MSNLKSCVRALKVRLSPFKKKLCYLLHWKLGKNDDKCFFISSLKLFSFSRCLSFCLCLRFWSCRKSDLINCKIHDVTIWLANNCFKHVAEYLTEWSQPDNETKSINRFSKRNIFLQKLCGTWDREIIPRPLFIYWKSLM